MSNNELRDIKDQMGSKLDGISSLDQFCILEPYTVISERLYEPGVDDVPQDTVDDKKPEEHGIRCSDPKKCKRKKRRRKRKAFFKKLWRKIF